MIIALAAPCIASALDEGLDKIKRFLSEASAQGAEIVCFPEAYLPGLRGQDFDVLPFDQTQQERVLQAVAQWARTYAVTTILGMERLTEAAGRLSPLSLTPGVTFRDTKPRISSPRAKISSMCPEIPGDSSRSTGSSLEWRFAMRAGAIPRRCDGRRGGASKSSFIPTTRGVINKVSV